MNEIANDYDISVQDADAIKGAVLLPAEFRRKCLEMYLAANGQDALIELFGQFMGMANSVADNCKELATSILITEGGVHLHTAEKINMPTVFGALNGIGLAGNCDSKGVCVGCAYRLGSAANQCLSTVIDAEYTAEGFDKFYCHDELDERGDPVRPCAGHQKVLKKLSRSLSDE